MIIDTGVIVAMSNRRDDYHHQCTELLTTTLEPLVLPEPLLVEIGYMPGSRASAHTEATFCTMSPMASTPWSRCTATT